MNFHICNTASYTYDTKEKLGCGATANVYKGCRKKDGLECAVKVLTREALSRNYEVQMRELEVLKKFRNENIVTLFDIEKEDHSRSMVIVMELCTGGSLLGILDDPKNAFGLQEEEFLVFLKNSSDGLSYLRDNNVVHRDIKPGNIMKCINSDSSYVYKLTDFGAARELEDINSPFHSIYGTEEYLHPDMYKRALLHVPDTKGYNQKVDLWSLGVTIFHTATGELPFRPYGGRQNKDTMYRLTSEKALGVISGIQTTMNGPITWSKELPKTSGLSRDLKQRIVPMLAGLMECDYKRMWTFDRFFHDVATIMSQVPIHVFVLHSMAHHILYLDKKISYSTLRANLASICGLSAGDVEILYQGYPLTDNDDKEKTLHTTFPTSLESPYIVVPKKNIALKDFELPAVAPFPVIPMAGRPNPYHDCECARLSLNSAYAISSNLELFHRAMQHTQNTVRPLIYTCQQTSSRLSSMLAVTESSLHMQAVTQQHMDRVYKAVLTVAASVAPHSPLSHDSQDKFAQLGDAMATLTDLQETCMNKLPQAQKSNVAISQEVSQLQNKWKGDTILSNAQRKNWTGQMVVLKETIKRLAMNFRERVNMRNLTHHVEKMHNFDKKKLDVGGNQATEVYKTGGNEGILAMYDALHVWIKDYLRRGEAATRQEDLINSVQKATKTFQEKLKQAQLLCCEILESLSSEEPQHPSPGSEESDRMDSLLATSEVFNIDQETFKDKMTEMYMQLSDGVKEIESGTNNMRTTMNENTDTIKQLESVLGKCLVNTDLDNISSDLKDISLGGNVSYNQRNAEKQS